MIGTILIADDSQTVRELYRQKLTQERFHVLVAGGGQEALQLLGKATPDLILLDLTMPDMDGDSILQVIRRQDRLKRVPVIVLSGNSDRTRMERAFALGATDYILKSTTPPDNVIRQIRFAISESRMALAS